MSKIKQRKVEKTKPKNIIIDTQVFEGQNFYFKSRVFRSLANLVEYRLVKIYITAINYGEVINRINKKYETALSNLKRNKEDLRILCNDEIFNQFIKGKKCINEILIKDFIRYMAETKIEVIDFTEVSLRKLFSAYFELKPPFNKSEKKAEFPDGISVELAQKYFSSKKETAIYISKDEDINSFISTLKSDYLVYQPDIGHVLESLYPELEIAKFKEYLSVNNDKLKEAISEKFEDIEIEFTYLEEVEIKKRKLFGVNIIGNSVIEEKNGIFYVIMKTEMEFELIIECNDPNGYYYDSEEKESIYVGEQVEMEIQRKIEQEIEIECEPIDDEESEWSFYIMDYILEINEEYDY